ncbi:radical SAM protein [Streptomyces sp. ISL-12]|uniref:radical SAM/SPASM domain-containing protein n=1 Tax=Streptomyces sp. ISL-12 TaxID=2819177 RepID=UPI001BE522F8|nr:radical SAM/SPASM domain-containing protein [Streptomyces sp. ISL-12]MBT2412841.1 radical SAM protein [Streptomyces sp. ISL-12]
MTTSTAVPVIKKPGAPGFLWLDLTRKCQLACGHCHNGSGADGSHGSMTAQDWTRVLDEATAAGVSRVQFTGGEVTLHPDAPALVEYALTLGLAVEVYSNLVHLNDAWWSLLRREGVSLATSYYGSEGAHNAVTGRGSHARTRANIVKAVADKVPVRVSVIVSDPSGTGDEAKRELQALGVRAVRVDHVRPFGRAANGREPCTDGLCGRCGDGRASIGPDGAVSPCVFSTWLSVGNVQEASLRAIFDGPEIAQANAAIREGRDLDAAFSCGPGSPCGPDSDDSRSCTPDTDDECSPGTPGSECTPRN